MPNSSIKQDSIANDSIESGKNENFTGNGRPLRQEIESEEMESEEDGEVGGNDEEREPRQQEESSEESDEDDGGGGGGFGGLISAFLSGLSKVSGFIS